MDQLAGASLALVASLSWAVGAVAMAKASAHGGNVFSGYILDRAAAITVVTIYLLSSGESLPSRPEAVAGFLGASVFGSVAGYVTYYLAIAYIGASRTTMINTMRPFLAAALAVPLFNESLSTNIIAGTIFVVLGVLTVARNGTAGTVPRKGIAYALFTMVSFTLFPIMIRIGLDYGGSPGAGAFLSMSMGLAMYLVVMLPLRRIRGMREVPRKAAFFFLSSGLSHAVGTVAFILALQIAPVVTVVPISNSYPFLTILMANLLLKEKITPSLTFGSILVGLGVVTVAL